jgi:hypothetical protein
MGMDIVLGQGQIIFRAGTNHFHNEEGNTVNAAWS